MNRRNRDAYEWYDSCLHIHSDCTDLIHIDSTGISSDGIISIAPSLSCIFTSIIPGKGAPLLGFKNAENVMSLVDFRGACDTMIPDIVSNGYYYTNLHDIMAALNDTTTCNGTREHCKTEYDALRN